MFCKGKYSFYPVNHFAFSALVKLLTYYSKKIIIDCFSLNHCLRIGGNDYLPKCIVLLG